MAGRQRRTERLAHRPRGRFVYDLHHATAQMNVITKIRAAIVSEAAIISTGGVLDTWLATTRRTRAAAPGACSWIVNTWPGATPAGTATWTWVGCGDKPPLVCAPHYAIVVYILLDSWRYHITSS